MSLVYFLLCFSFFDCCCVGGFGSERLVPDLRRSSCVLGVLMCREREDPLFLIERVLVFGVRIEIAGWERELTFGLERRVDFPWIYYPHT